MRITKFQGVWFMISQFADIAFENCGRPASSGIGKLLHTCIHTWGENLADADDPADRATMFELGHAQFYLRETEMVIPNPDKDVSEEQFKYVKFLYVTAANRLEDLEDQI